MTDNGGTEKAPAKAGGEGGDGGDGGGVMDAAAVHRVARLARVRLSDKEAEALVPELRAILGLVGQLRTADVSGVEPMTTPAAGSAPLREDEVESDAAAKALLALAPEEEDGLYRVPRVIEGQG